MILQDFVFLSISLITFYEFQILLQCDTISIPIPEDIHGCPVRRLSDGPGAMLVLKISLKITLNSYQNIDHAINRLLIIPKKNS